MESRKGINSCMSKQQKADPSSMDLIMTKMFLSVRPRHRCDPLRLFQIQACHAFAIGLVGTPVLGLQRDSPEKRWHPSHRTPQSGVLLWPQSQPPAFRSMCMSSHSHKKKSHTRAECNDQHRNRAKTYSTQAQKAGRSMAGAFSLSPPQAPVVRTAPSP